MMKQSLKSGVPCFKRWTRKYYGVFISLGREVKIGVLPATMSILTMIPGISSAQIDTTKVVEIEAASVTARLYPTRGNTLPVSTAYQSSKGEHSPLQTIESALRVNPAVDLRERGAKGVQADIALYGGNSDQTMVLLNGINFTDPRTGHQSHSLPIDLEVVGQINVMQGLPAIGAFTGALDLRTQRIKDNYLRTHISGGEHGYLYTNISGGTVIDSKNSIMAAASYRRSDGYTKNTDFNTVNLYVSGNHHSRLGDVNYQVGYQRKFFGANSFYSLAYPDQAEQTKTLLGSIYWTKRINRLELFSSVGFRKNLDRFELFRSQVEAPSWYTGHNYHRTDNLTAEAGGRYDFGALGELSAGADYTYNHIYSNVLGIEMQTPKAVKGYQDTYYTKQKSHNTYNLWMRYNKQWQRFIVAASGNLSDTDYGTYGMWSAMAGYRPANDLFFYASGVNSMRMPTFTDLYYTTSTHTGNIDLNPERALTTRIGANYGVENNNGERLIIDAAIYYRKGKNIIDWVKPTDGDKWQSMQITELNTRGAEVHISYMRRRSFLRELSASYGYVDTDLDSSGYISKYALDYMRNKASVKTTLQLFRSVSLDAVAVAYDRTGTYQNAAGDIVGYAPYWLLDSRLDWNGTFSFGSLNVYIEANNLLDRTYFDFGGLVQPGRWLCGGIVLTL